MNPSSWAVLGIPVPGISSDSTIVGGSVGSVVGAKLGTGLGVGTCSDEQVSKNCSLLKSVCSIKK